MTTRLPLRAGLLACWLALGIAAGGTQAAVEHADTHGHAAAPLSLDHGQKWATDAPLRQGMLNVRNALHAALPSIHANRYSAAQYRALAGKINREITQVVARCKLKPQADAQLHNILAGLLEGTRMMEEKSGNSQRQAGAVKVLQALDGYGNYFDHPGWQPLRH